MNGFHRFSRRDFDERDGFDELESAQVCRSDDQHPAPSERLEKRRDLPTDIRLVDDVLVDPGDVINRPSLGAAVLEAPLDDVVLRDSVQVRVGLDDGAAERFNRHPITLSITGLPPLLPLKGSPLPIRVVHQPERRPRVKQADIVAEDCGDGVREVAKRPGGSPRPGGGYGHSPIPS